MKTESMDGYLRTIRKQGIFIKQGDPRLEMVDILKYKGYVNKVQGFNRGYDITITPAGILFIEEGGFRGEKKRKTEEKLIKILGAVIGGAVGWLLKLFVR